MNVMNSKWWRWVPGMRALGQYGKRYPVRIIDYGERPFDTEDAKENDPFRWWQDPREHDGGPYPGPYLPDRDDAATRGCLLDLVREAFGDPKAYVMPTDDGFACCVNGWQHFHGASEWDAMANALLAAP